MVHYDKPVKNLIAGLNATGHVTHTQHRKTMVTLHHNAGRLSHEGVLEVWRTRPASAHLDVDGQGAVAQYVQLNEYAWACGSTNGNQQSISIEMANSGVGGNWPVAEVTWREAARLAGWLFWAVIGSRPSAANLVPHHHWKPTACAGPYIDNIFDLIISDAQQSYDYFVRLNAAPTPSAPSPSPTGKSISQLADEVLRGEWGNGDDRRVRLTAAGYDYTAVQQEVNRRIGAGAPHPEPRKSVDQVAREVIRGEWGNGVTRRQRLTGAGYNYDLVQRRVNELLR